MSKNAWPTESLSKLCSKIGDGIHGTPIYTEDKGYPFINGNNLKNGSIFISTDTKRVSTEEFQKYYIEFDSNTLFMSINGTLGNLAIYKNEQIILGKSAAYIKSNELNIDFLYYYLQLDGVQDLIWNVATGSTIKNLSLASIRSLKVPVPPPETAEKIAHVLKSIDKKIELNNRINTDLAKMAITLYDYWFVQFDFPDANGKPYKTSGGKMIHNPIIKREIPEGWDVEFLTNSCVVTDCLHSKKPNYHFDSEDSYLLQLENISDDGQISFGSKYHVSKQDYIAWTSRIEVQHLDIVMTNAGRIAAFAQIPKGIKCGIGRNITAIRPKTIKPNYFFMSLFGQDIQKQILTNLDHGAFFKMLQC